MQEGLTPNGEIVTGYKATDENMKCRGFQYEIGKWYEHEGGIAQCESGFHFCEYQSGPWAYYSEGRLFKCEAELVLKFNGPGADIKHVAKRIRLVEEINVTGDGNTGDGNTGDGNTGYRNTGYRNTGNLNTGDRNTGYGNTGDRNTGYRNTGNRNTGDGNTGDRNTGYRNTGDGNTGDRNTGDWNTGNLNTGYRNTGDGNTGDWNTGDWNTGDGNTGYGNTGDRNTGYRNTGDRNTGDGNTGDLNTGNRNTGDGNTGDHHSGCLNHGDAPFYIFNKLADRKDVDFDIVKDLSRALMGDKEIDPTPYLGLPHASAEAIKNLHEAHKEARRKLKG